MSSGRALLSVCTAAAGGRNPLQERRRVARGRSPVLDSNDGTVATSEVAQLQLLVALANLSQLLPELSLPWSVCFV